MIRIIPDIDSACIEDGLGRSVLRVEGCSNRGKLRWSFPNVPEGAPEPTVTDLGEGRYEVTAGVAGAYIVFVECCEPSNAS